MDGNGVYQELPLTLEAVGCDLYPNYVADVCSREENSRTPPSRTVPHPQSACLLTIKASAAKGLGRCRHTVASELIGLSLGCLSIRRERDLP
jgi:hypothetical protein